MPSFTRTLRPFASAALRPSLSKSFHTTRPRFAVSIIGSKTDLDNALRSKKPVALDCWAEWCGPCKMIGPHFEALSEKVQDIDFYKMDVDNVPELTQELGIRAMPTFFFFKDGKVVDNLVGANPAALVQAIERLRG